jgi:acetoacetyl-CoA synthetase
MTAPHRPQIRLYQEWLQASRGLSFESYDAVWQWSVTDLDAFWQSIWDYFDLQSPTPRSAVLSDGRMAVAGRPCRRYCQASAPYFAASDA